MTSVPNRPQQLSGNKTIWLGICCVMLLGSCDFFRKAQTGPKPKPDDDLGVIQGKKVYDPETGTWKEVVTTPVGMPVDTVRWSDLPDRTFPPITSSTPGSPESGTSSNTGPVVSPGGRYNVTMLMPFLSSQNDASSSTIDSRSNLGIHYYAGAKMALDVLEQEGANFRVNVLDTEASANQTDKLIKENTDLAASHLILGAYRRDNVALLAAFAKDRKIPYVSPYNVLSGISSDNPNYIQVNPSLQSHCQAITRHIHQQFKPEQVVLVCLDSPEEIARLKFFQDENLRIQGNAAGKLFREFVVKDDSPDFHKFDLSPYLANADETVFVVPSWAKEAFVYSFLRKAMITQQGQSGNIVVYGMPQWLDYENIDYDYYEKLNVRISASTFIDHNSQSIRDFKQAFFDRFAAAPRDDAYLGYDVTLFFGRMLMKYGPQFVNTIDQEHYQGLQTQFDFQKEVPPGAVGDDRLNRVDRYENKYLNILKFSNYHFQLD